ncbi:MAG TPA: phosphoribosylanthranilate isomerase [Candidatus Tenderia sp.]|nr:phosphoribosylanthranilate isomerase [Candidatus Tenderia sp.]
MAHTRIKICGITRPQDGLDAARLGADALGFVFYPPSPRAVDAEQAKAVIDVLPPFVTTVALFVNPAQHEVEQVLQRVAPDLIQFHGDESPEFCAQFARPYIKAVRMRPDVALDQLARQHHKAQALLLDAYQPGVAGGTGETFGWDRVPRNFSMPIVLAGGLTPGNVGEAIEQVRPYAVDVSGGVEAAKGIKDAAKIAAFMRGVKRVEVD